MSVSIDGGGLDLTLGVNLDSFTADLENGLKQAVSNTKELDNALFKAASGGAKAVKDTLVEAVKTSQEIAPLLEKGLSGLDPSKLEGLNNSLQGTNDQFEILQKTIEFVQENISTMDLNPEELSQLSAGIEKIKQTFAGVHEEQGTVLGQIRSMRGELYKTPPNEGIFSTLLGDTAELEERVKKVKAELKLAGSNAPGLVATGQAVQGLVAGFTALQGTIALVAGNNEDLEKTMTSLVAAMSILQSISAVMEVVDKNSALNTFLLAQSRKSAAAATTGQVLATEALAVAEVSQGVAAGGAAVAQSSLNAAIMANPAGILLAGLTALVAAIQFFTSNAKDATDQVKALNFELDKISTDANSIIEKIQFLNDLNTEKAKLRGSLESDISKSNIQAYKEEAAEYEKRIGEKILASRKFLSSEFNVTTQDLTRLNLLNAKAALLNEGLSDRERKVKESEVAFLESVMNDWTAISQLQQKIQLEDVKMIQQAFQESLRSAQGFAEARLLLAKRNTKAELDLEIAAIKARANSEINAGNLTAGEKKRIRAQEQREIEEARQRFRLVTLNDEKAFIEARLESVREGTGEELFLRIDLIKKAAEIELAQIGLTEGQKVKIKEEANRQIYDLSKKFTDQLVQDEIEARIAGINSSLSIIKAGTQEELKLRLSLANEEAKLEIARSNEQIKNEALLQAKIQEILSASLATQKKLQEDFVRDSLQKRFELSQRNTDLKNDPFQSVLNSTRSTANEKYNAQLVILRNNLQKLKDDQEAVSKELQQGQGDCEELTKSFEDLQRAINKANDEIEETENSKFSSEMKKLGQDISSVASALGQLSQSLSDTNPDLSASLQTLSDIGNVAGNVVTAVAQFSAGDIAGGISSAIKGIAGIFSIGKEARESRRQALADIEEFYSKIKAGELEVTQAYRERARELATANKIRLQGLLDEKRLLDEQKRSVQNQYNIILAQLQLESFVSDKVTKKYGGVLGIGRKTKSVEVLQSLAGKSFEELEKLFSSGQLTDKAKELFQMLQQIKNEGGDIDTLLAENAQNFKEAITGTNVDSISQSILDGFKQGLKSAADFASTFKELMQNALLQALQLKYLEAPLRDFFDEFAALSESDNQLTAGEVSQLQQVFNSIIQNANDQFQQLQQIAGIGFNNSNSSSNSLTGAIKGITEQQAELLAGQFGGLRITALEHLAVAKRQLDHLNQIQINTSLTAGRLAAMVDIYRAWETGAKKIHVQV